MHVRVQRFRIHLGRCVHANIDIHGIYTGRCVALLHLPSHLGCAMRCTRRRFYMSGVADSLDRYEAAMKEAFDIKVKGRLGTEDNDDKDMRVLNRIVRISGDALLYEPDPRHVELLARDLGLDMGATYRATPGDKPKYSEDAHAPTESHDDIVAACVPASRISCSIANVKLKVTFGPRIADFPVTTYYQAHPWYRLLTGSLGCSDSIPVPHSCDRFTGLTKQELATVRDANPLMPGPRL